MCLLTRLSTLARDARGSMVVETAVIAPVLVTMAIGGFEASRMIARQAEIQSAAAEAVGIVLAASPETTSEINTVKSIIRSSTQLTDGEVTLSTVYRCGTATALANNTNGCTSSQVVSTFLKISMEEEYVAVWNNFGIGTPPTFTVERTIQLS